MRWVESKWVSARPAEEKAKQSSTSHQNVEPEVPEHVRKRSDRQRGTGGRSALTVEGQSRQVGQVSETESPWL